MSGKAGNYVTGVVAAEAKVAAKIGPEAAAKWKRRCIEQSPMYEAGEARALASRRRDAEVQLQSIAAARPP